MNTKHEHLKTFHNVIALFNGKTSQTVFVTPNVVFTTKDKKPLKFKQVKGYMLKAYRRDCSSVCSRTNCLIGNLEMGCVYTNEGYNQCHFPGPTERRPGVPRLPTPAPGQGRRLPQSRTADSFEPFPSLASTGRLRQTQRHLSTWGGGEARGLTR